MAQKHESPVPWGGNWASEAVQAGHQNKLRNNTARWRPLQSPTPLSARELTTALGGQWRGSYGSARCPAHDDHDPSLGIIEDEGRVRVKCHAGCDWRAVVAILADRGLWPDRVTAFTSRVPVLPRLKQPDAGTAHPGDAARRIWGHTRPADNTIVEDYLRGRGIAIALPPSLRLHPSLRLDGAVRPAMVAAVEHVGTSGVVAVHRTFLELGADDGPPQRIAKKMLGPVAGGAVRLAPQASEMGVAEGIETALSVMLALGIPMWACLSAEGLKQVVLPPLPLASTVIVFADNDANGCGMRAAMAAKDRLVLEGRRVRVFCPPTPGTDFNDMLQD